MLDLKKYVLSVEVYKYLYCARLDDTEDYLSDKICCYTIKIRKKIIKKAKWLIVYGDFVFLCVDIHTNYIVASLISKQTTSLHKVLLEV